MALSGSKSYTLTIGNGPLAITIGTIHSASGLDASSYAEALPTLSLSPKTSQGKTVSVRPPAPRSSSPLEVYHLLASGRPDTLSNLHIYGHRRPHHNYLKSFCLRPVACWSPFTWGLE